MSSGDCGPFDNDTAADFAGDLDEAPESARLGMLHAALAAVGRCGGDIDGSRAEVALAAAAVVARDLPGGAEFQSRYFGPRNRIPPILADLISLATGVADRLVNGENDVKDYWNESGKAARWLAMMRRLRTVLAGDPSSTMDPLW